MVLIITMCYLVGLLLVFLMVAMLAGMDIDWKYLDLHPLYILAWPLLPILLLRDLILYINNYLTKNNLKPEDIDLFIFHQANLRINDMVAKQFNIPEEKVFNTIQKFANTTAATIPIGLDEAVRAGKLKKGMLVASAAFGSGFTWASAVYRY